MLRDPALIPLSRQHQHALALCVRIERALRDRSADLSAWQAEVAHLFDQEIRFHFDAEERVLFPVAERFPELRGLVQELRQEHIALRAAMTLAGQGKLTRSQLEDFGVELSEHIRREERHLFEGLQKHLSPAELAHLGGAVDDDFRASGLPATSCEIRPRG